MQPKFRFVRESHLTARTVLRVGSWPVEGTQRPLGLVCVGAVDPTGEVIRLGPASGLGGQAPCVERPQNPTTI